MSDRKFLIMISLFALIGLSLALALLKMVLNDGGQDTFAGATSMKRAGGPPAQSLNFNSR